MSIFKREVVRCYYEFKTLKDIGPTGDFIEPGLYYTTMPFPAMEAQSDRAWNLLGNNTMEESSRPVHMATPEAERTWVELKAQRLDWAMVAEYD